MPITAALKSWLIENCGVKDAATDDELRKAVADALANGKLSPQKLVELTATKEDEEAGESAKLFKDLAGTLTQLKDILTTKKEEPKEEVKEEKAETKEDSKEEPKEEPAKAKTPSRFEKMIANAGGNRLIETEDGEEKEFSVRVKEAAEQYSTTKTAMIYPSHNMNGKSHPSAGRPVMNYSDPSQAGRSIDNPSELDKAVAGAYAKFLASTAKLKGSRTFGFQSLPQHDRELLCYAMENMKWGGSSDGGDYADIKDRLLTPNEQKALIDDATSGGLEAAPIVFDDQVIQTPLLHGELFPHVNTVPLDRGRRVEGVATGTVTGSWGGVDDSAIGLFNTTSYVSAFDTTIFRWEGAIRIGLDFLSDTPIDFGQHVTSQYGERLLEDLDDVIADGNGSTQPEGAMQKTGATSVNFGGTTSIGNYESLMFSVSKNERRPQFAGSIVFCGNETSYQRARALPVSGTDDRRLGGGLGTIGGVGDYLNWLWMGHSYKINETLTNQEIFYAVLGRYRMYRRRGLTMRSSTEGDTLIRNNEMLLVAMARYGGQFERGAVVGRTTTAPA
jgi:HK97 family phage major capsid protein